ncbi:hypothetical protein BNJ_00311 [Kaumoebavirus]|uniref:hypothetical protein n=1 Tax=Kaumoebavirus TaxID=1859492 RepID=UPI0009C258F6|nr:hypothetical protein BNJ_00311 [Kaumoebavirus]ARA72133.1 hypothetical protein BNJ_00311 [Kaumoebavirus]
MDRIIEVVPELSKAFNDKSHDRHKEAVQYIVRLFNIMQKVLYKNKGLVEDIAETCKELLETI